MLFPTAPSLAIPKAISNSRLDAQLMKPFFCRINFVPNFTVVIDYISYVNLF